MCRESFSVVLAMQQRLVEREVSREQEELFRRRLGSELARVEREGMVGMHKRTIQEEVLLLRCPRCQVAFVDFDG